MDEDEGWIPLGSIGLETGAMDVTYRFTPARASAVELTEKPPRTYPAGTSTEDVLHDLLD